MDDTSDGPTDVQSPEPRKEDNETTDTGQAEQYHAVIEPDPLLEEVGEANERAGQRSEPRRVIPSKPC